MEMKACNGTFVSENYLYTYILLHIIFAMLFALSVLGNNSNNDYLYASMYYLQL